MLDAITLSKYGGVLVVLILAGFGAPVPEEIPIVTAGAMVGHDAQDLAYHDELAGAVGGGMVAYLDPDPTHLTRWWVMLPLCIVGVVAGDGILFSVGRRWGSRLIRTGWVQRHFLPPELQTKIETNFDKYGILILLGARLTPGVRSPVFLMAGVLRMPLSRFLLADALYAIPGVNILFWLAYVFTDQFVSAINAVEKHRPLVIVAVLSALGGVLLYRLVVNRKATSGDPREIPAYAKPVGAVTHAIEQTIEKAAGKTVSATAAVIDKVTHPHGHHPKPAAEPAAEAPSAVPAAAAADPAEDAPHVPG